MVPNFVILYEIHEYAYPVSRGIFQEPNNRVNRDFTVLPG